MTVAEPSGLGPHAQVIHDPGLRVDRGRGYQRVSPTHVRVSDLDLASWFHLKGMAVVEVLTNGREFAITFFDPEEANRVQDLALEWLNSEACQFSSALRQLKKVCIAGPRARSTNRR